MSRLFIELYLDEDVDVLVREMLRAYGFVAESELPMPPSWRTPAAGAAFC